MAETAITPRQAIYAHLKGDANVFALVGSRIYHQVPPLDATYPLIVVNTISNVERRDLSGVAYRETRLQITTMASSLAEAEQIALAVRDSLEGFVGLMAGVLPVIGCRVVSYMPIYQEETGQTHYHVDVVITHDA